MAHDVGGPADGVAVERDLLVGEGKGRVFLTGYRPEHGVELPHLEAPVVEARVAHGAGEAPRGGYLGVGLGHDQVGARAAGPQDGGDEGEEPLGLIKEIAVRVARVF